MAKDDRKLAAILAADVVDYSRLMGADEQGTLAALKTRRALFDELVREFGGFEFGSVGDSLMAEFPSAGNAVQCALAIQQRVESENAPLPAMRRMQLRIGVHLGDVIEEKGCAFGDTVNVAARLQALAKPGGVLISGPVHDQVRLRIPARFIGAGTRQVKNIAEPVKTFEVLPVERPGFAGRTAAFFSRIASRRVRLAAAGILALGAAVAVGLLGRDLYVSKTDERDASSAAMSDPGFSRSVAVLAFEDRGGSAGDQILAEGIPETVIHQLGRIPGLTVISRGSSFAFQGQRQDLRDIGRKLNVRYLLEGSVQTAARRLRVTSSLVDTQSGASVWSMQFDRTPQDVFAVQDEIAIEVARAMRMVLTAGSGSGPQADRSGTENYDAYLAFVRGRALLASQRIADLPAAAQALTDSLRHDPEFTAAQVLLARARISLAERNPGDDPETTFRAAIGEAMQLLDRAIEMDPKNGEAYVERGYARIYFDLAAADADFRRGIEFAPNHARGYEGLAAVLFQSGARRREALEIIDKARRLDPLEPRLDVIKATYLFFGPGDVRQATQLLESVLERDPLYLPALVRLGELRLIGQRELAEAIQINEQALALDPENEYLWRQLAITYMCIGDFEAARATMRHIPAGRDHDGAWLAMHIYGKDWLKAGEIAHKMIATNQTNPYEESYVALAVRMYARETGNYRNAIEALQEWTGVSWEDGEPVLPGQLMMGLGVVGLADMLAESGRAEQARTLLEAHLADIDFQMQRFERGEMWISESRSIAVALLDRRQDAIRMLRRQFEGDLMQHRAEIMMQRDPAFESLRADPAFIALLREFRAVIADERAQLQQMRKDRLVPER